MLMDRVFESVVVIALHDQSSRVVRGEKYKCRGEHVMSYSTRVVFSMIVVQI